LIITKVITSWWEPLNDDQLFSNLWELALWKLVKCFTKKWKPQPEVIYFVKTKYDEYQKIRYPPNINPLMQILIQGWYCLRLYQCGQFFHIEINTSLHYQVPNWCPPNISSSTPMQLEHTNFGWFFFFFSFPKWLGRF